MGAIQLIPFEQADLKALASAFAGITDEEFSTGQKPSFGVLRIAGKQFAITKGKERTVIKDAENLPARTVDVVVLRTSKGMSKTYYAGKFDPNNPSPPDCYSNTGDKPAADAKSPQAVSCAKCKHNVFGSKINELGNKAKACSDSKRLAVASPTALDEPLLLSIPPASFQNYDAFVKWVAGHGLIPPAVVVRIGFGDENYPKLTFAPKSAVPMALAADVKAARESETVLAIVGAERTMEEMVPAVTEEIPFGTPAPAPVPASAEVAPDPILAAMDGLDIDSALAGIDFSLK